MLDSSKLLFGYLESDFEYAVLVELMLVQIVKQPLQPK